MKTLIDQYRGKVKKLCIYIFFLRIFFAVTTTSWTNRYPLKRLVIRNFNQSGIEGDLPHCSRIFKVEKLLSINTKPQNVTKISHICLRARIEELQYTWKKNLFLQPNINQPSSLVSVWDLQRDNWIGCSHLAVYAKVLFLVYGSLHLFEPSCDQLRL